MLNHTLVRLSAYRCGIEHFENYLVLGDDVVIARKEVALEYKLLLERIGVSISEPKSAILRDGLNGLEFASRIFSEEKDYSPVPLGDLLIGNPQGIIQF
jgi:hypothetical protein